MKNKSLFASLICVSLNVACSKSGSDTATSTLTEQQRDPTLSQQKQQIDPALERWVGHYQADTPCVTCTEFCDGCNGTHVDLQIDANQHYTLVQQRNAEGEKQQRYEGRFIFVDTDKNKIQLVGVKQRNLIVKSDDVTEIYNQETGQAYSGHDDFALEQS